MIIKNALSGLLAILAISCCSAQISFTFLVTNATCSSNGSLQINASGGTGTLNYELSSTCLPVPLYQQSPNFNNLSPCVYTVVVTDGDTGASATQTAEVGGSYQIPDLSLNCGTCDIVASVAGGAAPLTYAYSTVGLNGPFINNAPTSNPIFDDVQASTNYWIKVTDACGNVAVETCQTVGGILSDFISEVGLDGKLRVTSVVGGNGTLLYTLSSSNGIFSNSTGVFPPNTWGCGMSVTVSDGCSQFTKAVSVRPVILSICSNFAEGNAALGTVVNGIPPYTFNYISPNNTTISSTNGMLTGLPVNFNFYLFQVVDACGNVSDAIYKQKKYPIFQQDPAVTCSETSISLFTPNGGCHGGFDVDSWPFDVTCLSCVPVQTGQVDTAGVSITFEGNTPGNWEFDVEDGCADQMVCKDSVILEIQPFCDSLKASLIDRFTCDNGALSDRPMSTENGLFVLFDANDAVLSSNNTGNFYVPDSGTYKVTLTIPGCGTYYASATIGHWEPVNPTMYTYIYNTIVGTSCITQYQLVISPEQGPFLLTGGPNNISMLLDENSLTSNCQHYSVAGLYPGEYLLSELDHCGTKALHLPAPVFDLEAIPFGNCPGSGTITVSGAQDLAAWQAWGAANQAEITWPSSITDNYSLDAVSNGSLTAQNGSPYTFSNVQAGFHTVYLYTLNSSCPVDTATIFVPEAASLAFDASSGILCDGSATTTLHFEVLSGKPPYLLEQVDCSNPTQVLATYNLPDTTISIPGFPIGDYCFRLVDSCITSLDHQFSVQYFQDDIELAFNCDNTVTLSVDSLNATYLWMDANGNTVGNSQKLTFPNPNAAASFKVMVDLGECTIQRSITVPATEIVPSLQIHGDRYFCENDSVTLTSITQATLIAWSNGAQTTEITTGIPGLYAATVTNDLGCSTTEDFLLTLDVPVAEIQVLSGGSGFGLNCFQDSNGVLRANPMVGIAPFQFEWVNIDSSQVISGLKTGDFTLILTDSVGCRDTATITLTEPDLFVPQLDFSGPGCFGTDNGFIEIPGWSGGAGGVKARLSGSIFKSAPLIFDNLPPGDFLVEISDANGCTVDSILYFEAPQQLDLELGSDQTIELGDSIYLDPQLSFTPIDSFVWRTSPDQMPITALAGWAKPLENVVYTLTVWDEFGCPVTDNVHLRVTKELDIYVPNAFSPNGDGVNDLFTIYGRSAAVSRVKRFQVFDRFGELVFDRENFAPNDAPMGWNGRLDNQPMNPAVFVWKATIEFIDGRVEVLYGDVTLMN